jgi:hypothetical protein
LSNNILKILSSFCIFNDKGMIGLGLFVMAALGIVLLSIISPQYQWTNGSLTSSMNQTDGFNTITNQSSASDRNETNSQIK